MTIETMTIEFRYDNLRLPDIGNNADTGQFVLGQPLNRLNRHNAWRLRTIVDLYPEVANAALDDDSQPSCSAAESLNRQHAFINPTAFSELAVFSITAPS